MTAETLHIEDYITAATAANTRQAYQAAIAHFEVDWGGFLPASADAVARYLANYAGKLAVNTLRQRLAALARWHSDQGFPDPTKAPLVRKVLKGIQVLHPKQELQAKPLQIERLEQLVTWLDKQQESAHAAKDRPKLLKATRDKALLLIGFWRGFRSDELRNLRVEHVEIVPNEGMRLFLAGTKTGARTYCAPALSRLCPVAAYQDWITTAGLTQGAVFRRIDRWGRLGTEPLHPDSFIPLLRNLFAAARIPLADRYTSHSLRRGFASWANSNGWDTRTLMEHVGWRDAKSAIRYIEGNDPFGRHRVELSLTQPAASSETRHMLPCPNFTYTAKSPAAH